MWRPCDCGRGQRTERDKDSDDNDREVVYVRDVMFFSGEQRWTRKEGAYYLKEDLYAQHDSDGLVGISRQNRIVCFIVVFHE